ncbi:hypothetical protein G6F70_003516 [Rhizopus microsporus]|nr:hypothetical protein G6F71_003511 [Rhizopus microsporus]KAG1201020.1 hypothetical protein G6F70_003516 [Rhizopus microsporus]KAG1212884.1 hypothetical protein G6F69_003324 [Rhizopus microsporus]KAG1234864.1 hypothetical protein G6F67_003218 [Rhizopus microsporus]KAG1267106.1 hypothetical protein G6F68_002219 [Rhizopus microsporus]
MESWFCPPLWRQRRSFIVDILDRFQIKSVIDYGCGEGNILSFLITPSDNNQITKIAGVDISKEELEKATEACLPWPSDYSQKRLHPLMIDIYQGSIGEPDKRLKGYEAIICSEVIEHVYQDVLDSFFQVALGFYRPKILIVTTPNYEYNVHFPNLHYGTDKASLRHLDHKFEWTREQFKAWCTEGAERTREEEKEEEEGVIEERYKLIKHIEFPYFDEIPTSSQILKEISDYIEALCKADHYYYYKRPKRNRPRCSIEIDKTVDWNTFDIKTVVRHDEEKREQYHEPGLYTHCPVELPLEQLWSIARVRYLCQGIVDNLKSRLSELKDIREENNTIIINKSFKIDD